MEWKLDDSRPIWMQLEEQLTRRILSGWYKAGENFQQCVTWLQKQV